jgi:hypothetical protein
MLTGHQHGYICRGKEAFSEAESDAGFSSFTLVMSAVLSHGLEHKTGQPALSGRVEELVAAICCPMA